MDVVRWVFETNGCVATEADLFDALISSGLGTSVANNTVVRVSNEPTTEVIERDPFTYRYRGSALCR